MIQINLKIRLKLISELGLLNSLKILTAKIFRRKLVKITVGGHNVWVRSGSTDLEVVLNSLVREEFAPLLSASDSRLGSLIVDGGAHIGTSSIALTNLFPGIKVIAVECDYENYQLLIRNTAPYPHIYPLLAGLSDKSGISAVQDPGLGHWGYSLALKSTQHHLQRGLVPLISLDQICAFFEKSVIRILKLDVEGAEYQILSDNRVGSSVEVGLLFVEIHGPHSSIEELTSSLSNFDLLGTFGEKLLFKGRLRNQGTNPWSNDVAD